MAPRIIMFLFLAMSLLIRSHSTMKPEQAQDLPARLDTTAPLVKCWNAVKELRSCSHQIVAFFINGDRSALDPVCCGAVELLTRHCWPHMITALGFTPQEANILRGFCDAASSSPPHAAAPPLISTSPAPSPQPQLTSLDMYK